MSNPTNTLAVGLPPVAPKSEIVTRLDAELADIATRIRSEHAAFAATFKQAIVHAFTAGELLNAAKGKLPHGKWLPFVKEDCRMAERTAQLYMQLAAGRPAIEAKSATLADLTFNEALKLINATALQSVGDGTTPVTGGATETTSAGQTPAKSSSKSKAVTPASTKLSDDADKYLEKLLDVLEQMSAKPRTAIATSIVYNLVRKRYVNLRELIEEERRKRRRPSLACGQIDRALGAISAPFCIPQHNNSACPFDLANTLILLRFIELL